MTMRTVRAQKKEAEEGSDNVVVQPVKEDDFIRSTMRHDSSMRTVTVANMNSDLKVGAETKISKDTDEKDNRPDSSEQTEDTSDLMTLMKNLRYRGRPDIQKS